MSTERSTLTDRLPEYLRQELDRDLLLNFLTPVLIILGWEVGVVAGTINDRFFPPPSQVVGVAGEMLADGSLVHHTSVSLGRIVPAFVVAGALGIILGLLMGWSERINAIVDPLVSAIYPLPKVVLLPIIFLIFGLNDISRMVALGAAVFLLVVINTVGGAREVNEEYIEAARDNGASGYSMIREVIFPASLPHIFSGLSLGMGVSFILIVVVEMIAAENGLGYVIWNSWNLFTMKRMYVAIITINILGILFTYGIEWTGAYLTRWREA